MKEDGTACFRASRWSEALVTYQAALGRLPKRKERKKRRADADILAEEDPRADLPPLRRPGNGNGAQDPDTAEAEAEAKNGLEGDANGDEKEDVVPFSELEQECAKARSILNANIGACHVKLVRKDATHARLCCVYICAGRAQRGCGGLYRWCASFKLLCLRKV